jgi:hypothetical protein
VELSSRQPLLQAFLLQGSWAGAAISAFSSWLVYLKFREGLPLPPLWHSGCPALFATCLLLLLFIHFGFFSFFPGWGSVCPGGYADLAQGCLWEYRVPLSSPGCVRLWGRWELASGSTGALLVSPFNVKWGCYMQAGSVEVSQFCLFLVVFSCKVFLQCLSKILL